MYKDLLIIIPAIKKNALIPDQLIKKLNGVTLLQRAINTAKEITSNIFFVTDSQEIALISERNNIEYYFDSKLHFDDNTILDTINEIIVDIGKNDIMIYRANAPLVGSDILNEAYELFLEDRDSILISVTNIDRRFLVCKDQLLEKVQESFFEELRVFYIYSKECSKKRLFKPFFIDCEKSIEIDSYQSWWVCEKVLQRKRIIFHVVGNINIGMGHIYHSLALAHEITDHEVIFVCDEKYKVAVDKIAATDYKVISSKDPLNSIIRLNPDMVINDILDTSIDYIRKIKETGAIVVNFEDLSEASKEADLVFNELYDVKQIDGNQYRWGYEYVSLRDEFDHAKPHDFSNVVSSVLISFGGTDQNNLSLVTLKAIINESIMRDIKIYMVCGVGYAFREELEMFVKRNGYSNCELIYASDVISKIMEKTQIAFSSNGRTVYELAEMNIPSVIISHHKREDSHCFAALENGFINLGVYSGTITALKIKEKFIKLVDDMDYRKLLYLNMVKYKFKNNKQKVVKEIMSLL